MSSSSSAPGVPIPWRSLPVDSGKMEQLRLECYRYALEHQNTIDLYDVHQCIKPPLEYCDLVENILQRQAKSKSKWKLQSNFWSTNHTNDNNINQFDIIDSNCSSPSISSSPKSSSPLRLSPPIIIKDWWLHRLLILSAPYFQPTMAKQSVSIALEKFIQIFTIRTQYHIPYITPQNSIPIESYRLKMFSINTIDRDGMHVLLVRTKFYRNISQLDHFVKNSLFLVHEFADYLYQRGVISGVTLLLDMQQFPWRHALLSSSSPSSFYAKDGSGVWNLLHFLLRLPYQYPGIIRRGLVYELPWPMRVMFRVAKSIVIAAINSMNDGNNDDNEHQDNPNENNNVITAKDCSYKNLIQLITADNIDNFIAQDQRPSYLNGGTYRYDYDDEEEEEEEEEDDEGGKDKNANPSPSSLASTIISSLMKSGYANALTFEQLITEYNGKLFDIKREDARKMVQHIANCLEKENVSD